MANRIKIHKAVFATSALSPEIIIDPRDVIVAIKTESDYVGITLAGEFSFDEGTTWTAVNDKSGTQVAIISDASLASGQAYSVKQVDWDVSNRFKLRSSSAVEVGTVTILTRPRV